MNENNQEHKTSAKTNTPKKIKDVPKIGNPSNMGEIKHSQLASLSEHHKEFAEFHEGYVSRYIQLADTKASWVFALASALLVFMVSDNDLNAMYISLKGDVIGNGIILGIILGIFALLLLSALFAFLVIAPNLRSPSGEGVVFFGTVAKYQDNNTYVTTVAKLTDQEMTKLRLKHCFDVSKVCAKKYKNLKCAIWLGATGAFLLVALVFLRTL